MIIEIDTLSSGFVSLPLYDPVLQGRPVRNHLVQIVPNQQLPTFDLLELLGQVHVVPQKQQLGDIVEGRPELN